ncbi:hypothetical protein BLNAU_17104 [Blattamonas nauphoetae]|uniref:Uncharacterized protein n=1 Tax=Blattamonas nauphoetae TaxID=2049346 RepID=A0ABQ9XCN1_9EUKA|nr:hypothetical protein BLNAU_17104 [Blattamonas nauphoetae]
MKGRKGNWKPTWSPPFDISQLVHFFRNSSLNAEMSINHSRNFNNKDRIHGLLHVHRESLEVEHATIIFAKLNNVDKYIHSVGHNGVTNATLLFFLLSAFFERGVKIIFDHNGILDKFIDEFIMATWGGHIFAGDERTSDESEEKDDVPISMSKGAEKETTDGREIRREQRIIQQSPQLTTIQAVRAALDIWLKIHHTEHLHVPPTEATQCQHRTEYMEDHRWVSGGEDEVGVDDGG